MIPKLKFYKVADIHSTIHEAFRDGIVNRGRIKLYHTAQCDGHEVSFKEHMAHLIYKPADEEGSILLTSEPPFEKWTSLIFPDPLKEFSVLSMAWDIQRNTMVLLMKDPNKVQTALLNFLRYLATVKVISFSSGSKGGLPCRVENVLGPQLNLSPEGSENFSGPHLTNNSGCMIPSTMVAQPVSYIPKLIRLLLFYGNNCELVRS